jgi:putative ABC transport system permease protein
MRLSTTFGLAMSSMLERPTRTLLTSLGIIIGVASVFAMLAIGEATRREVLEQANSISTRTISVYPDWEGSRRSSQQRPSPSFTEADVVEMRALDGVFAATGTVDTNTAVVSETADWNSETVGIDTHYLRANELKIDMGAAIDAVDIEQRATVALIGQTVAKTLYRDQNPVGQRLKIASVPFIVKGVISKNEQQNWRGQDPDDFVLVPLTTARNRLVGGDPNVRAHVRSIKVVGEPDADLVRLQAEIDTILRRSRDIKANAAPDFRLFNFAANINAYAKSREVFAILLAAMGTVSLIVGGVGVMNIMLVSVTERTREIGLRMAIGARGSDVMAQFLTEALMLCTFGGLVGLLLGYSTSFLPIWGEDLKLVFSWQSAALAFGSALAIGIIFGLLPARRAAGLNPIEALRHE